MYSIEKNTHFVLPKKWIRMLVFYIHIVKLSTLCGQRSVFLPFCAILFLILIEISSEQFNENNASTAIESLGNCTELIICRYKSYDLLRSFIRIGGSEDFGQCFRSVT